jgi:hypothetical protein
MASKVQGLYVLILDLIGPAASKSLANPPVSHDPYHHLFFVLLVLLIAACI